MPFINGHFRERGAICWGCLCDIDWYGGCGCSKPRIATVEKPLKMHPGWLELRARVNADEIAAGRGPLPASKYFAPAHTSASAPPPPADSPRRDR